MRLDNESVLTKYGDKNPGINIPGSPGFPKPKTDDDS